MPLAKVRPAKAALQELRKELEKEHRRQASAVAKDVGEEIERLLGRTLKYANQNLGAFADAQVVVNSSINITRRGAVISISAHMGDESGGLHYIWHLVESGIPQRIQTRTSPPIEVVRSNRTTPNSLDVGPYTGTGILYRIPQGAKVPKRGPVPARNWYRITNRELRVYMRRNHPGWDIVTSKVK